MVYGASYDIPSSLFASIALHRLPLPLSWLKRSTPPIERAFCFDCLRVWGCCLLACSTHVASTWKWVQYCFPLNRLQVDPTDPIMGCDASSVEFTHSLLAPPPPRSACTSQRCRLQTPPSARWRDYVSTVKFKSLFIHVLFRLVFTHVLVIVGPVSTFQSIKILDIDPDFVY